MNKPFLIEIQPNNLGDTIFLGPSLQELSKFYDIIFVGNKVFKSFFENWSFVKHFIWVELLNDSSWWQIIQNPYNCNKAAAIKEEIKKLIGYTNRAFMRSVFTPPTSIKNVENYYGIPFLNIQKFNSKHNKCSLTVKQLTRILRNEQKIEEIHDEVKFVPTFFIEPSANKKQIVLCDGSWNDRCRSLHYSMLNLLCEHLAKKYTNEGYEIVCLYDISRDPFINKLPNVNYICTNGDYEASVKIKNIFEAGISLFIVPDSGLAYVALSCNIPVIWIESRIRAEWRIPPYYAIQKIATMWRRKTWNCQMNCDAASYIKRHGIEQKIYPEEAPGLEVKEFYKFLRCKEEPIIPCMNFSQQDIEELDTVIQTKLNVCC